MAVENGNLDEIAADDLASALDSALPWDLSRRLANEAPTHFQAPTGTVAPIDYEAEGGPSIALRVQVAAPPIILGVSAIRILNCLGNCCWSLCDCSRCRLCCYEYG